MKIKKILLNTLPLLFIGTVMLYAAAPNGGYMQGSTSDPDCAPGDANCFVQLPVDQDNQNLTLSGTNLEIEDGNSVNLSGLQGMNLWSQTGSMLYYNSGNVGIGTTMPDAKLAIDAPNSHIKLKDNNNESTDVGQVISIQGYGSDGVRNFFIGDGSSLRNDLRIKSDNNSITLETTESDNLVIDGTTGNVGVGTNDPSAQFTVADSVQFSSITDGILTADVDGNISTSSMIDLSQNNDPLIILTSGQSNFVRTNNYNWNMPKNVRIWNNELNQTGTPGVVFEDLSGLQSVSHVPTMFAAEVARSNPHRIVYLINVSYSAQSIDKWLDNNSDPDMHAAIRENVNAALSTLPGKSTIDLFLWWQGESDRGESELYKDRWDEMINDLKNEDWFMPETPELIFGTNTSDNPISPAPNTDIDNMIPVFQEIVSDKPWHRKYIHTNDLEFSDGVHLSGQGQLDAAKRAYNIYEYGFTYRADLAAGAYTETPNKFVDGTDSSDAVYMNGNVGIGTTMPDAKLAIDAPNSHIKLKDNNNESTDVGQVISIQGYGSDGVRNFFIGDGSSLRNDLRIKSDNNSITLETTESDNLVIDGTTGNVGVGTNSISNAAKLQINGSVKIGQSSLDCDSSTAGAIRYNVSINKHQGCNSTSWVDLY